MIYATLDDGDSEKALLHQEQRLRREYPRGISCVKLIIDRRYQRLTSKPEISV